MAGTGAPVPSFVPSEIEEKRAGVDWHKRKGCSCREGQMRGDLYLGAEGWRTLRGVRASMCVARSLSSCATPYLQLLLYSSTRTPGLPPHVQPKVSERNGTRTKPIEREQKRREEIVPSPTILSLDTNVTFQEPRTSRRLHWNLIALHPQVPGSLRPSARCQSNPPPRFYECRCHRRWPLGVSGYS